MSYALASTYKYMAGEEGKAGTMTVAVLVLACVVMLTFMMAYPETSEALALAN